MTLKLPAPNLDSPAIDTLATPVARPAKATTGTVWHNDVETLLSAVLPGDHRHARTGNVNDYRAAIDALIDLTLEVRTRLAA
ncbi:MAG: hypothetical protein AAF432_04095 [Planctomycetota bacterium]